VYKALPLWFFGAAGKRKVLDLVMGYEPQEIATPLGAAFVEFSQLLLAHYKVRTSPLPVFSDRQLRTLRMPMLAITGGRDAIIDSAGTRRRLAASVPSARRHDLPHAGHALTDQTGTVLEFLMSVEAP
jgi:pimeloyl-ACP methyl ester carboxylesterase